MALATAIVLTVAGGPVLAETSTVGSQFILDKTEIAVGGESTINLSLLGLDKNGKVDLNGADQGSTIIAVVKTTLGVINGGSEEPNISSTGGMAPDTGYWSSQVRYVRLQEGKGRVSIRYLPETIGDSVKTDVVTVRLQERAVTAGGGVEFHPIGESVEKTITINPPNNAPGGLDIIEFVKHADDVLGKTDNDETDGILGGMTVGQDGAQITVEAVNEDAAGEVTVSLRSVKKDADAAPDYTFSERMEKGKAIITLDDSVTVAGTYYMKATFEGYDDISSVSLLTKDKLVAHDTRIPSKLDISTTRVRVASDSPETVMVDWLDEYGNRILVDEYGNQITGSTFGTAQAKLEIKSTNAPNFQKQQGMVFQKELVDTYILVAKAVNSNNEPMPTISGSEEYSVQVVETELQVEGIFTNSPLAGTEFDFAKVTVSTGQEVGALVLKNLVTKEVIQVNRKTDGSNIVQGYYEKAGSTLFLISDNAGIFGEVVVDTNAKIEPAAANQVKFHDAHGEERSTVLPEKDGKQYRVELPEVAFKMFDAYGNDIGTGSSTDTGNFTVTSSNAKAPVYKTSNGLGVPGRNEVPYGYVELTYDTEGNTAFAGEDNIEANFTKPGLGSNVLTIGAAIPALPKLSSIASYIETTEIPVNSNVVMTVETLDEDDKLLKDDNTTVTITFGAGTGGDTIVPVVSLNEIRNEDGTAIVVNEKQVSTGESVLFQNGRVVFVIEAGAQEGQFTIKFADANNTIEEVRTFTVTERLDILEVTPASVEIAGAGTASVTISGGAAPYNVESDDDAVATATLEADGTTVTITGEAAGDTSVTITDDRNGATSVAVTVTAAATEDDCIAAGNVYVDGECQTLPDTGGAGGAGSVAIDSSGNFTTSSAKFSGGWTAGTGGAYATSIILDKDGGDAIAAQVILFDPDHEGEDVDIILLLAVQLPPSFGPVYWYVVSGTSGIVGPTLALDVAAIEALETHTVVADEPKVMGPYVFEDLALKVVADFMFYFGYRTGDGTIYFSGEPIILQVR